MLQDTTNPCRSGGAAIRLARDEASLATIYFECSTAIAGKPGSHRVMCMVSAFGFPNATRQSIRLTGLILAKNTATNI